MTKRGARLADYELIRKIASGGMAEIFLARRWGAAGFVRDVVIKRLFPHLAEHERQLLMFQDEARLLSQLSHPNIPQVYDVGFADGFWFIAMEHVDGPTVADLLRFGAAKSGQRLPIDVAIGLVVQTCDALHHAHERKDRAGRALRIVHRDVTPHNIMVTRDGVAKLMDFGVASTAARRDTDAGAVRGTLSYMAPEQVRGCALDKRADVFALGVVLYELTTGARLYRGSDVQVMTQVVEQDAPPPSDRVPGYPEQLEEIVLAALARDRDLRLPSAAHLASHLEDFAMRHGLRIGPRTIARYVASVSPAEPEPDEHFERLEIEPHLGSGSFSEARPVWGSTGERSLPDIDEKEVLDDLQLLSIADDESTFAPELGSVDLVDSLEEVQGPLDDDTDAEHATAPSLDSGALVLDAFLDDGARPVVLLDERSLDGSASRVRTRSADYVDELERRLAGERED